MLIVGIFYVISMWCEVVGIGASNVVAFAAEHPADMYPILTERFLGKTAQDILQVLLVTSLFACILSLHNIVVRYQYVLGRYGVLPARLADVHGHHGSPHVSSLIQTASSAIFLIALIVIGLDPVTQIYAWGATAGTLGYMVILSLTCVSVVVFFSRTGKDTRVWNTKIAPIGGLIGLLFCLWIAIANLPALIGGDGAASIAVVMGLVVALSFAVGYAAALLLKTRFSARFEALRELA